MLSSKTAQAIKTNKIYKEGFTSKLPKRNESAKITVEAKTTFDSARQYIDCGKICVLNFANPENPGGGVRFGAMAQEECLCRSSNLYPCINDSNVFNEYYLYHRNQSPKDHFYTDRLIYTRDITVFKDDNPVPQLLPKQEWFTTDIITCAAPYSAERKYTNLSVLFSIFEKRIKNIFEAARENGVEVLVLGAFGCGAFKNPPDLTAAAFAKVIREQNYLSDFKRIVFAIKPTGEFCPNLYAFSNEFSYAEVPRGYQGQNTAEISDCKPLMRRFFRTPALSMNLSKTEDFKAWQLKNKYFGKQFSILGDSISTLYGYNPMGYNIFYNGENCTKSRVIHMRDTWWDKVISFFGGELLVNNSWSGSRVTKLPGEAQLFPSGCSDERTSALHINEIKPNVIFIYLGTNDWSSGVQPYNNKPIRIFQEPDKEIFEFAYDSMLKKIIKNYPQSEIWCFTLCEACIKRNPEFKFLPDYAGVDIKNYNNIIRQVANLNKCRLVDLYKFRTPYDSIDGFHPTYDGMKTIATMVMRSMAVQETESFIEI